MKKIKMRDSNFELLRIVAMILIVFHHIIVHAVYPQLLPGYDGPGEMFNNFVFYKRLVILYYGAMAGRIGNALFILVTGYFLCGKKSFNIDSKIKKLLGYTLFGTLVLFIASICYGLFIDNSISKIETINSFNDNWWFIGYYLLIIIIGKYIINKQIIKLNQKEYSTLLLILFAVVSFGWSRDILISLCRGLDTLIAGLFYYCLGGYINKYKIYKKIKVKYLIIFLVILLLVSALNYRSIVLKDINEQLSAGSEIYYQYRISVPEYDFLSVLIALVLFGLFTKIKFKNNKYINYVSSSVLLIYILHDCEFSRFLMRKINFVYLLHENIVMFSVNCFIVIAMIFMMGIIINSIYNLIIKFIKNKITT